MRRRWMVMMAAVVFVGLVVVGCDRGPMQKAGEKIDNVTDQDKIIGKGPAEKAGKEVDKTVRDLKR